MKVALIVLVVVIALCLIVPSLPYIMLGMVIGIVSLGIHYAVAFPIIAAVVAVVLYFVFR